MYQRGSWHRIFFAANSGIDELASLLNALKNAHNGRGKRSANCKSYIHDDKSVQIVLLSPEASELVYGLENYFEELIISEPPGTVGYTSADIKNKLGSTVSMFYAVNPMVGVIDGFQWSLLRAPVPLDGRELLTSVVVVILLVASGIWYFRKMERTFADVI